jgi:hypothetical protein
VLVSFGVGINITNYEDLRRAKGRNAQ